LSKARYLMIGGFLGAGKTTAMRNLAKRLADAGQRVGLITNDQSTGLVDTAILGAAGFPTEEITGGCFCCQFNSLVAAAEKLTAESQPDVFLAEPVGSCTDLKATVSYPLRRIYGEHYSIAPLSVMLDPVRALRVLGVEAGKVFSPKVVYIYEKQLEEAEILVINKCDQIGGGRIDALQAALRQRYPDKEILRISARTGEGVAEWLARLEAGSLVETPSMDVDYQEYAEGEALLGWLNSTIQVASGADSSNGHLNDGGEFDGGEFDGNAFVLDCMRRLQAELHVESVEVAHLKMTLSPTGGGSDLAVANYVRDDLPPELSYRLAAPLQKGELILNLRAEGPPETLEAIVSRVLRAVHGSTRLILDVEHLEAFRPSPPTPTHRLV